MFQLAQIPARAGLVQGAKAPEFELENLAGGTVSLFDVLKGGKPAVLSFFGTWCETCLKEIEELPEITRQSGAPVYLIGLDGDKDKLERFVKKHSIKYPVLWDPKARTMGRKYDVLRGAILLVPKTVVISPAGSVEYSADSYDESRKTALTEELLKLSGKKWDKASELAVFFTGSINGRLKPSYSAQKNGGGLIKFVTFMKKQAERYPDRLLVDTGDFLPYGVSPAQAEAVFKAMDLAGYDAVAVGDQDLNFEGFAAAAAKKTLPLVASSITPKDGKYAGLSGKTVTAAGVRVRILSFISPEAFSFYPDEFAGRFELGGLKEALKDGKNCDLLMLLSHSGLEENKKLAEEFKEIDLIIGGHSQEATPKPVKAGNSLILQTGGNLQAAGRLILRFDGERKLLPGREESYETLQIPDASPVAPEPAGMTDGGKKDKQGTR